MFRDLYCFSTLEMLCIEMHMLQRRVNLMKNAFDDKLKVSCPASMGNYLICMHCFEINTSAFFGIRTGISLVRGVTTCARAV